MSYVEKALLSFEKGNDSAGAQLLKDGLMYYGDGLLRMLRECETADAGMLAHMMRLQADSIVRSIPGAAEVVAICQAAFDSRMVIINAPVHKIEED